MEDCLAKLKEIKIIPISNPSGIATDIYSHFFKEDENTRLDRDSKTV